MKSRYTTLDIKACLAELLKSEIFGLRVVNVYDVDNKTYLIKLSSADKKAMILIESGNRIHLTDFEWPKNMMPSGFSMKCRKHLRNKRLVYAKQLGDDRIINFCFGYNEAAYHLIVELYDKGNIVLADHEFTILQLLRIRKDSDDVRFAVREKYPIEKARPEEPEVSIERLKEILQNGKDGEQLKRVLNPSLIFGPALLEHCLLEAEFKPGCKFGSGFKIDEDIDRLHAAIRKGEEIMALVSRGEAKGYIIQKVERKQGLSPQTGGDNELLTYSEFQPYLFRQHENNPFVEFNSFNKAVDEFFSKLESHKLDIKTLQLEQNALKKLENVKQDHYKRLEGLQKFQDLGLRKAALIELNLPLVDQAIKVVNSAIANKVDWEEIDEIVKEAQSQEDPVACSIKELKLDTNQIVMKLVDPYAEHLDDSSSEDDHEDLRKKKKKKPEFTLVDISLGSTAFANSRNYHDKRRHAASKEQKTIDASSKALKSAERRAKQTLKEVATSAQINKARKLYWFEKFLWFISSENYLVIAGRDQQQNELLVKKYLKTGDLYVHADLHGASSVILKNPSKQPVPPRTLNEAGTMAICYSAAWQARVVTSAWWVYHYQVSKTAPSGEYLTTGSFMIRGKKNYLPPSYLIMGFGIMFKLDESCVENHVNERKSKFLDEASDPAITEKSEAAEEDEREIDIGDTDEEENKEEDLGKVENPVSEQPNHLKDSIDDSPDQLIESRDNLDREHNEAEGTIEETEEIDEESIFKNRRELSKGKTNLNDDSDDDQGDALYPDTSIQLQYVSGERFQLQSTVTAPDRTPVEEIHRGGYDGNGKEAGSDMSESKKDQHQKKPRLSAKQRRDLKKKSKQGDLVSKDNVDERKQRNEFVNETKEVSVEVEAVEQQKMQQPAKRGQKGKKKKIKEKYKDQDDEDKEIIMQLLGSAGDGKDQKGKKKGKKESRNAERVRQHSGKNIKKTQPQPLILSSDSLDGNEADGDIVLPDASGKLSTVQEDQLDDDEGDAVTEDVDKENISLLDTLTSLPVPDDLLLFAIPTCAPYSTMQNYKYKVKVMPGTGKKGKAAKTAIHLFSTSKDASLREKDLFRSLKDVDVSRNIPGKVKISAPNLQKSKK